MEHRSPEVCRGPGIDGFYRLEDGPRRAGDFLRMLRGWGPLEVFGVEVLSQKLS